MNNYILEHNIGVINMSFNKNVDLATIQIDQDIITLTKEEALRVVDFILLSFDITYHSPAYEYVSIRMPKEVKEEV